MFVFVTIIMAWSLLVCMSKPTILPLPCQPAAREESVSYQGKMPKDGGLMRNPVRDPFLRVKRAPVTVWTPPEDQKVAKNTAPTVKAIPCCERVATFFGTWH